mgnify:CR=1 FL=1
MKDKHKEKYFKVYKGVNFHVNATLLSFLNPESFTAVENALSAKLSSDNFTISFKDYRGRNVVEDLKGTFSNSSMTLTLGGVGSQTKLKYADDSRSSNSYSYNRYNSYNKRPSKSKLKPRLVKREYWNFKQYQLNRLYVNYEGGTYSRQNTYSNYSRRTQRSQQANIGTCTICMEYLSNDGGSFFRQRLMTDIGFWGSVVPLFHALSKKSSWDENDAHGFSSEYNPYRKYVTNTAWTAAAGATVFGLWRMMLWDADISLDLILKKGPKENVRMYNSDTDFLRSTVTLNAVEQGLITKNHDIFEWDPVNPESGKNKNKTLAIFYIEIPIKISDVKNISSIEIE